jgi:hypothetical protein
MASRRELERLLKRIDKAESDREFALKHGYDTAYAKKNAEIKGLQDQYRKGKR